jgi:hypothetical protein
MCLKYWTNHILKGYKFFNKVVLYFDFLIMQGIPTDHPVITVVKPTECQSEDHMASFFNQICQDRPEDKRGEGVVLRDPTAWYFKKDSFFKKEV